MIAFIFFFFFFSLLWEKAPGWGFKDGVLHNSIWLERAAGVYHREARAGKYQLTYREAKAVCEYEGGHLANYQQLEAARKIGFHVCAAGWMAKGRVGYPIVKPGVNCGFGKTGIVDYGLRLNRSERWDAYCYNPQGRFVKNTISLNACYSQPNCKSLHDQSIYNLFFRYCGDELPEDIVSTGNVMTLKFLSDASVTAGGFQIKYVAFDASSKKNDGKNTTSPGNTNFFAGRFGIM
uniref:TNF alpha induced protein 6 n=1 Tax=Sphenodon punctatus TaxID=8508 RepID=A0A8D0GDW2_SPHPU